MLDQETSPAGLAFAERVREDLSPNTLPVLPRTWRSLAGMGINLDSGEYRFLSEGTHIWSSFFLHWGWWKTTAVGFYPYTDLRDYEAHERQGIGRPWLGLLPQRWQELIFRELILLVGDWNSIVSPSCHFHFREGEELPRWMERWLSLTNESWRRGASEFETELYHCMDSDEKESLAAKIAQQYRASGTTWRPMMPEEAAYHRPYGKRKGFWTFTPTLLAFYALVSLVADSTNLG